MTSLRNAVRIFSTCENPACGKKFEQDPAVIFKGMKDRFCGDPACVEQAAPECICKACGSGTDPAKAAYNLPICAACQDIAAWSCWRKRIFPSSFDARRWLQVYQVTGLGKELTEYKCKLCGRWHATSWSVTERPSAEYAARVTAIGAVFAAEGFDIDAARGYTNNPDGSHELNETPLSALEYAETLLKKRGRAT